MSKSEIVYNGDKDVNNVHHIGVEYNGNYYSIIFGEYVNGGFCSIPNWGVGCELSELDDIPYNIIQLGKVFLNEKVGRVIAEAIAKCSKK